jgi:GNAT superfamily N-acetyltransferase
VTSNGTVGKSDGGRGTKRGASSWIIRRGTSADRDGVADLLLELDQFHAAARPELYRAVVGPMPGRPTLEVLEAGQEGVVLVAESAGRLVGLVTVTVRVAPDRPPLVPRRFAVADDLVVAHGQRRNGLGRALMQRARRWAIEQGVGALELTVLEFNRPARHLYRALGYVTMSRRLSLRLPEK